MARVEAKWDFPSNNGGVSYGLTDAARTYFQADRLRHVTREVIQNSIDSHDTGFPLVEVEISDRAIPKTAFEGDQLASHFGACIEEVQRIGATNAQRDIEVLQRGIKTLSRSTVRCLTVVDSGTRGLRDPNWHALVESEGIVQKDGLVSGGSFGIGKNAVFTISDIFAVIYSTRYSAGRRGRVEKCQGKARLMTHPRPQLNGGAAMPSPNDYLQNTGFYRSDDMEPLMGKEDIPDEFRLHDAAGAGIFILGFNPHSEDWASDVKHAVCENFFMAVHNRRLRVTIRPASGKPVVVDHETIDDILSAPEASTDVYHFYNVVRRGDANHSTRSVNPLGKLDVYLDPNNGPSRTAYVNSKGMLITASSDQKINPVSPRRRVTWTDYTAVVTPQTDDGDLWVRSMESPAHDAIQPDQLSEPEQQQQAKAAFSKVRRQLRAIIDSEMEARHVEVSENLSELAQYLPENEGEVSSERQLSVTRIQTRPPETPILDQADDEELDAGEIPERDPGGGATGDQGRVEGETEALLGRRRRTMPRVPIRDPRVIPISSDQVRVSFTPRLEAKRSVDVTIHPRGYEATAEAAILIQEVQSPLSDGTECSLLEGSRVRVTPELNERISLLLTTTDQIEQISAFDLWVREAK